jgi:hypothetical protein
MGDRNAMEVFSISRVFENDTSQWDEGFLCFEQNCLSYDTWSMQGAVDLNDAHPFLPATPV